MKLKCLGSRPFGRQPIFVSQLHRLVAPGEVIEARDQTWAELVICAYPGCFDVCHEPPPVATEKIKRNARDKMLGENPVEKEAD
jgi:hypothetical protein